MRTRIWMAGMMVLAGMTARGLVGCSTDYSDLYTPFTDPNLATWPDAGDDGGDAGDSGPPPGCIPVQSKDPVNDACGVFVSSSAGDDGNAGTKDKPLKTLGAALAKAGGKPVYACAEGFSEALELSGSVILYGALDCADGWVYDASKKTQLTAGADEIPVSVTKATTSAEISDFAITAADAVKDGGSSVAVLAALGALSFERCDVVAGNGQAGSPGAAYAMAAQAGSGGNDGKPACDGPASLGGLSVQNMCGGVISTGGSGGIGDTGNGGDGSGGKPAGAMNGGIGEDTKACTNGQPGDPGTPGMPGTGASGLGMLSANGYSGTSGGDGNPGGVAQGGGGGGGAKGELTTNVCAAGMGGGASGGSGGAGGCGGLGGKGGMAGGSSIAILNLNASLSFAEVTVKVGSGGHGGDGGDGQLGGDGGMPGAGGGLPMGVTALNPACSGGKGGNGGNGGKGGGGLGGHALGIASSGKAPSLSGVVFSQGAAGLGGKGDNTNGNPGDGGDGRAASCFDFDTMAECK